MDNVQKPKDPERIGRAALQAFFSISDKWGLDNAQKTVLLGNPDESQFLHWANEQRDDNLDEDILTRISLVIGIFKSLHRLLPPENADGWIKRNNEAELFNGQPALTKMLTGNLRDLEDVFRYLEAECA